MERRRADGLRLSSRRVVTLKTHLPAIGIAAALVCFGVAAGSYPGGTTDSPNTVGYSWTSNFLSSLFGPRALNGAPNGARFFAITAMVFVCMSLAFAFWRISRRVRSRVHAKTIEIAGIGTAIYSCLVDTPMHDLMVTIGLVFTMVALLATTHALYIERRWVLFVWGATGIALGIVSAVMYYGHVWYGFLPVVQKVSLLACISWLLCTYYALISRHENEPAETAVVGQRG